MDGIEIFGVRSARASGRLLREEDRCRRADRGSRRPDAVATTAAPARRLDLADVVGQFEAKWALEVAAAGRHHVLFTGPPGVGKTMLAERLPGLLPDLDPGRVVGGVGGALARRHRPVRRADHPAAVRRPAPLGVAGQRRRRRTAGGEAGRDLLRPPRRALPGRGARVPRQGAGRAADAVGVRGDHAGSEPVAGPVSGPVPARPGRESLPVRAWRPPRVGSAPARRWPSAGTRTRSPRPIRDRIDISPGLPAAAKGLPQRRRAGPSRPRTWPRGWPKRGPGRRGRLLGTGWHDQRRGAGSVPASAAARCRAARR